MFAPGFESRRYVNGVELKPGAVISHDPQVQLRFSIQAVCVTVNPDTWAGQLSFNGRVVAESNPCATFEQAADAARTLLTERITALFAG